MPYGAHTRPDTPIFWTSTASASSRRLQSSCLPLSPSRSTPPPLPAPVPRRPRRGRHLASTTASQHGGKPLTSPTPGRPKTSPRRQRVSEHHLRGKWHSSCHVPDTLLNNYLFDGARADLSKSLSMNPMFSVTHSFNMGSQTIPPSYGFGAMFVNEQVRFYPVTAYELSAHASFSSSLCTVISTTKGTCQRVSTRAGHQIASPNFSRRYVRLTSPLYAPRAASGGRIMSAILNATCTAVRNTRAECRSG